MKPLEEMNKEELFYAMARHIRNTDGLAAAQWGLRGALILEKVRLLDEKLYDRLVREEK